MIEAEEGRKPDRKWRIHYKDNLKHKMHLQVQKCKKKPFYIDNHAQKWKLPSYIWLVALNAGLIFPLLPSLKLMRTFNPKDSVHLYQ